MISQEKDKFICEKLGLCCHPTEKFMRATANYGHCSLCHTNLLFKNCDSIPCFSSEAGRVQLLKLIKTHKDYDDYADFYLLFSHWDEKEKKINGKPEPLMTDDTGLFRDTVFKWLGGVE